MLFVVVLLFAAAVVVSASCLPVFDARPLLVYTCFVVVVVGVVDSCFVACTDPCDRKMCDVAVVKCSEGGTTAR